MDKQRIKQIGLEADAYAHTLYQLRGELWHAVRDEHFAKAVARECQVLVRPSAEHRANPIDYIAGEDGIALLDAVADKIDEHFGLGD